MIEYNSDDNPIIVVNKKIEPIPALDHSSIEYEPLNKDFYEEKPSMSGMSEQDFSDYRRSLAIRISGFDTPKPIKTFEDRGFSPQLMTLIKKQGYEKQSSIQCQALPVVLSGRDIIGIAKTGYGKTAAFVLPMIVHNMDLGMAIAPLRSVFQLFLSFSFLFFIMEEFFLISIPCEDRVKFLIATLNFIKKKKTK